VRRESQTVDREIDPLFYGLHGLSGEEIAVGSGGEDGEERIEDGGWRLKEEVTG